MPKSVVTWTDERVALLIRLRVTDKLTYAQVADRLGVTKNTAIGKAKRIGLTKSKPPPRRPASAVKHDRSPQARAVPGSAERLAVLTEVAKVRAAERAVPVVDCGGVAMVDLLERHCRWPLDNGHSCGVAKTRGAYCAKHGARAYTGVRASTATRPGRRT